MRRAVRGQVLLTFALVVPIVLIPVLAYAVEGTLLVQRGAALAEATAQAAEDAVQQIDVGTLRAGGGLTIDPLASRAAAAADLSALDPTATITAFSSSGGVVTIATSDTVRVQLAFWVAGGQVTLTAHASARLAAGYSSPISRLPLPRRIF